MTVKKDRISPHNDRILILSHFLSSLVFSIPIWIVYYQGRVSPAQISFLVGFQYLVQMVCELPTGAIADLIGRKKTVILGFLMNAVGMVLILISRDFGTLALAVAALGLGDALLSGSVEALIYDSHKQDGTTDRFQSVQATNSFWFQIGLAAAAATGAFLFSLWQGLPYVFNVVVLIIAALLSFRFIEPTVSTIRFSFRNYIAQMRLGLIEAFKTKQAAAMSLFYIAVAGITWTNNLYFFDYILVELGLNSFERGWSAAGIRILNITVLKALLSNPHIFTRSRSVMFFPLVMSICFLPGIFLAGWWAIPLVGGAVMAGTARWVILTRYTNEYFDSKYRATAISVLSMFVGFFYITITMASGPVVASYGVRAMYTILGVLSVLFVLPLSIVVLRNSTK